MLWDRVVSAFREVCDALPDVRVSLEFKPTDENTRFFAVPSTGAALGGGVQVCGSPGEVASDPLLGHRYKCLLRGQEEGRDAGLVFMLLAVARPNTEDRTDRARRREADVRVSLDVTYTPFSASSTHSYT